MKVIIVTPRFSLSGVPLAQIRLAQSLKRLGHEVLLVIGYINKGYKLPENIGVDIKILGHSRVFMLAPQLSFIFRKFKPSVIFSAEDHLNIIVLIAKIVSGCGAKITASSRVTPFDTYSNKIFSKSWVLFILMRALMKKPKVLTCVSEDMVNQYKEVFPNSLHVCIYNIVVDSLSHKKMEERLNDDWFNPKYKMIVAAGRLAPWKGFSDLINAINIVKETKNVRLAILGDGPLRHELQLLIQELNLESVVKLYGYVDNTLKYFKASDVFVLSSYVEGLPNVLVEAMMCGCTPVSTDCKTGPREVIKRNKSGFLTPVGDIKAMSKNINMAIDNPIERIDLKRAIEPFSEYCVLEKHRVSLEIKREEFYLK